MIKNVQVVSVPVSDQEQAKSFYVDALEFEVRADNPFGEGMRWIEVAPKGSTTSLTLVTWFEGMPPGSLQGLVVATDDIQPIHEELVAKGVSFDLPPTEMSNGTQAMFRDPDGNAIVLLERTSFAVQEGARRGSG